mgnify:CR=1 FL=1
MSFSRSAPRFILSVLTSFVLLTSLACIDVSAELGAADTTTRTFTESFPATGEVRLANLAGSVVLVAGTGSEITVEATVHAEGRDAAETERLLQSLSWVAAKDGKGWALSYPTGDYRGFHYAGREGGSFFGWGGQTTSKYQGERVSIYGKRRARVPTLYADLEITVPRGSALAVRNVVGEVAGGDLTIASLTVDTGSGAVRLADVDGDLAVDTGSGHVELGQVRGDLHVDTGSGHVQVAGLTGNGTIDTGSGHIDVTRIDADELELDTGSGHIQVSGGRADRVRADTGSGGIVLADVDVVELEADTGSGGVEVTSSLARAERIDVDTGSGGVTITGGPDASFDFRADLGSGQVSVGYDDADLIRDGRKLVGARRGDGRTVIRVDTGSGGASLSPGR